MAIQKMKFINIVGPNKKFDTFVKKHILQTNIQLENAISYLGDIKGLYPYMESNPYDRLMKEANNLYEQIGVSECVRPGILKNYSVEEMEEYFASRGDKIKGFISKKEVLLEQLNNNKQIIKQLTPMKHVDVSLDNLFNMKFIKFRFGRLPKESYKKLQMYLEDVEVFVSPVLHEYDYVWMVYFIPSAYEEEIDSIFSHLYFERVWITGRVHGKPIQAIEQIEKEIEQLHSELEKLDMELNAFVMKEKESVCNIYAEIKYLYMAFDVRKYAAHTNEYFYILGWIPEEDLDAFVIEIEKESSISAMVEEPEMVKQIKPPTELKNTAIFRPFEYLVKMYGLPSYNEIDPTVLIGIIYVFLFGMMFGDVGQGAVLAIGGWYLYKKRKMHMAGVVSFAGVSSMIFGVLYGSIFGYEDVFDALLISPLHNINTMLIVSIGLGVILITIAILTNIINGIKTKDTAKILFDKNGVAGLVFYWSIIIIALYSLMQGKIVVSGIVLVVCILIPLLCITMKEPLENILHKKKNILPEDKSGFFAEAVAELIETLLGFLSNTISFVRVSAFALNHAGLFIAIFTLAKMAQGVGSIIAVIIGNILVIVLEGLIVGIQGMRLSYYELFSRFFSGEGREFKPLNVIHKNRN